MARSTEIAPGIQYRWPENGASPSADSFLLADFALPRLRGRVCDLCSGAGLVALLSAVKSPAPEFVCADIDKGALSLSVQNAENAGVGGRVHAAECDLRRWKERFSPGEFDCVVCNPPYHESDRGKLSAVCPMARSETDCTLGEVCSAAAGLLRHGGRFFACMKASRLAELMCAMRAEKIEPKRLRFVSHSVGKAPYLVLCEGIRGAASSVQVMPELYLFENDGKPTAESDRIYYGIGE